ncbi:MAG: alpha/beta fold hydrolase [Rhizobiaceae bacterium]|nr:alpha/beta fold hydrolase [Rhizobiaceae bacterium]
MQRLNSRLMADDWPNSAHSTLVEAGGMRVHVQRFGAADGEPVVLVHGTAASTHSFAALCDVLERLQPGRFHFTLIDLPGHGYTEPPAGFQPTLPNMATVAAAVFDALGLDGALGIGHSAGGAILLDIARTRPGLLSRVITLNAALEPMRGHAFLSPLAKGLFLNPLTPQMFAWRARFGGMTRILMRATGSVLDEAQMARYQKLLEDPAHVRGALAMMANWDLQPLQDAMPMIAAPVTLIAAEDDSFVPARVSREAAQRLANGHFTPVALGGHLVHETDPDLIAAMIVECVAHGPMADV